MKLGMLALALSGCLAALPPTTTAANDRSLTQALTALGWAELAIPGKAPAHYRLTGDGAVEARSDSGVSILYRTLDPEERKSRILSWRWRVDEAVPATNLEEAGKDDRDLAVHLWFPDEEQPGLWKTMWQAGKTVLGLPPIGRAITYVFGGTGERHRRLASPYDPDAILVLLRPTGTETGKWFDERVDFVADYEAAFGTTPPKPVYLAISSDSDDTGARPVAWIDEIAFHRE